MGCFGSCKRLSDEGPNDGPMHPRQEHTHPTPPGQYQCQLCWCDPSQTCEAIARSCSGRFSPLDHVLLEITHAHIIQLLQLHSKHAQFFGVANVDESFAKLTTTTLACMRGTRATPEEGTVTDVPVSARPPPGVLAKA